MAAGLGLALALAAAAAGGAAGARPAAGGNGAAGADAAFRAQPLRAAAEGALELGASPGWVSGWPSGPLAPWWAAEGVTVGDAMESAFGVLEGHGGADLPELELEAEEDPLPAAFDWREQMPACVGGIKDQGKCGSCWAVSTAEAFSDRLCLARHAAGQTAAFEMMSALDLIACDRKCQHPFLHRGCNMGCQGGFPATAWDFVQKQGLHSDTCLPYDLSKQLRPMHCADKSSLRTDPAQKTYFTFKTQAPHGLRELLNDGPITAVFTIYQDFMNYAGGIYEHNESKKNRKIGYHAVKIVGWGAADDGTKFLICQNSWGPAWGEDGFFRIKLFDSGMGAQLFGGKVHLRKEEAFLGEPAQLMSPVP